MPKVFIELLSIAFVFIGTYLNVIAFGEAHHFDPNELMSRVYATMGIAVLFAIGVAFVLSRLPQSRRFEKAVSILVTFLFLETVFNYCALPFLKLGLATSFVFDHEPHFRRAGFIALDAGLAILAAFASVFLHQVKRTFRPERFFIVISSLFLFFQAYGFVHAYPPTSFLREKLDYADVMKFDPSKKNTLVIIPDGFSGSEFSKAIHDHPELAQGFPGYVFYKNTLSRHGGTWGSVPEMVGGPDYLVTQLRAKKKSWFELYHDALDSLDQRLQKTGSGLDFIYGEHSMGISPEEKIDVFQSNSLSFSFLKVAPSFLKYGIYKRIQEKSDLTSRSKWGFLLRLLSQVSVGPNNKVKLFHVMVPHAPQFIPAGCEFNSPEYAHYESSSYTDEAVCFLKYLSKLNQRLKDLGVYDQTEIIVVSDHGWIGHSFDFAPDMQGFGAGTFETRADPGMLQALLLRKVQASNTPFTINSEQFMSNADLFAMLCGEWNGCSDRPDPFSLRDRTLNFYISNEQYEMKATFEVKSSPFEKKNWRRVQ